MTQIPVVEKIMSANDHMAVQNRSDFDTAGLMGINMMASPGAGKTSLILATIDRLPDRIRPGVIEGDVASSIDADKIAERNVPVTQINTGGSCHLDASMVRSALPHLALSEIDLLFIENVGNLICPAVFQLGTHRSIVVPSVPEGDDKPYKYPGMFATVDAVVLNKADMIEVFEFDVDYFSQGVKMVNPDVPILVVSCRTGEGMDAWMEWLLAQMEAVEG